MSNYKKLKAMKKRMIIPMALATSMMMFSCASSNENMNATAMDDDMSMSSTQTMGGTASDASEGETLTVEETAVAVMPVGTISSTTLQMENSVDVNDMFEGLGDTESQDVLSLARTSPNLSTFVTLIEQAGLVDDLQRVEELTLLAPTNEAFAKLPQEKLQMLLMPDNKAQLMAILQAHVIPSNVSTLQLESNTRIRLTEDTYIPIETSGAAANSMITIGGARIVKGNTEASNGTIHVIDSVIIPSQNAREDTGITN
ncbi:hypothetical protein GCM10028895_23030 [Pontibacter rugosus]